MIKRKRGARYLAAEVIALINSGILFVKSVQDTIAGNTTAFDYCLLRAYFISLCISAYLFVCTVIDTLKTRKLTFKISNKSGIAEYLVNFMEKGGRTVVLSRDLSWVTDDLIGRLERKSRKKDLIVFMPRLNETAKRLQKAGADVRCFGEALTDGASNIVKSRFTIIQWDSYSARITYPKEDHSYHYNFEYVMGEPAMELAQDLIRLLIHMVPEKGDEDG